MFPDNSTMFLLIKIIKTIMLQQLRLIRVPKKADLSVCITIFKLFVLTASSFFFQPWLCCGVCVQTVCFVVLNTS